MLKACYTVITFQITNYLSKTYLERNGHGYLNFTVAVHLKMSHITQTVHFTIAFQEKHRSSIYNESNQSVH